MRSLKICSLLLGFVAAPAAYAGGGMFSETAPGGSINDNSVQFFPLTFSTSNQPISDVTLTINGLWHPRPGDLNIFLLDPFGNSVEVMDDRGNGLPVEGVDLTFSDTAGGQLPMGGQIVSGEYLPESGMFAQYINGGTDAWILVVIDDAADNMGSANFDSFTIAGVPEPMTLSLLGVGAVALLRRKR